MKKLFLILVLNVILFGSQYYAKLEPIETYEMKAATSGAVIIVNDDLKGQVSNNKIVVKLDSFVDEVNLKETIQKLNILKNILKIEQDTYEKFKSIRSKSQIEKDAQYIKVLNLKSQETDLIIKRDTIKDTIVKKSIKATNRYINDIKVKVGDYVNPGTILFVASDISKAKLEIFIPIDEADTILSKKIFIDDKETDYKISKLYKIADTKHISSYKCEIDIDAPKLFSKLVKIDFK